MKYANIKKAAFIERINRFVAKVMCDGKETVVHVKNTGRCRELLLPGATVYLTAPDSPGRKTKYDLVAVEKVTDSGVLTINMDSQAPNDIAQEWLLREKPFGEGAVIRREVFFGDSRFDFMIENSNSRTYLEVKGVTLEENGVASFPDAPTERGVKHIRELIKCKEAGFGAYILFIIQMKGVRLLVPNDATHKAFGDALRDASAAGVNILAIDCIVTPDTVVADAWVEVSLDNK